MLKPKILIALNDLSVSMKLGYYLERNGYDVISIISDSEKAIDIAKKDHPDLVIIDILLEGKTDCIKTLKRIQSIDNKTAIICVSLLRELDIDEETKLKISELNQHNIIFSPLVFDEFLSSIELSLTDKDKTVNLF